MSETTDDDVIAVIGPDAHLYREGKAREAAEAEVWPEGPLKELLVEYVGQSTETEEITVELIVEAMAKEFPEFLMVIAEENWIRGYQQAIHDVDEGERMLVQHAAEDGSNETNGT